MNIANVSLTRAAGVALAAVAETAAAVARNSSGSGHRRARISFTEAGIEPPSLRQASSTYKTARKIDTTTRIVLKIGIVIAPS
ncbi:hypothetical protein [Bradyrhizobium sp. Ce-3]|uniref:hypothetical protein n=1 Tax=Bradyrhizobium sp. Ce-3 TaxID=2913970 RepID=UPI001FC8DEB4|nr:hypothetical protein [Bradyrhizobium sp. Ce-3]